MIVASLGVLIGALFSSGMMEIARNGIFVPSMFSFNDVMIIFLAVMITDILLLDFFLFLKFFSKILKNKINKNLDVSEDS